MRSIRRRRLVPRQLRTHLACPDSLVALGGQRKLLSPGVRVTRSMPEHFVAYVGPELFCHIEEGIQGYLLSPLIRCISKRSIHGRIVEVGDACGHSISGQFGCVEGVAAIVAASNNFPAHRISSSLPKPPGAFHEISGILVQSDWK